MGLETSRKYVNKGVGAGSTVTGRGMGRGNKVNTGRGRIVKTESIATATATGGKGTGIKDKGRIGTGRVVQTLNLEPVQVSSEPSRIDELLNASNYFIFLSIHDNNLQGWKHFYHSVPNELRGGPDT